MPGIYGDRTYGDPIHSHVGIIYKHSGSVGTAWTQIANLAVSYFNKGFITFANTNESDSFAVKIYGNTNGVETDPGGEAIGDGWFNVAEINQERIYASSDYNHEAEITVVAGKVASIPINIPLQQISIYAKGAVPDTAVRAFGYCMM